MKNSNLLTWFRLLRRHSDMATTTLGSIAVVAITLNQCDIYPYTFGAIAAVAGGLFSFLTNKPDPSRVDRLGRKDG